MHSEQYISDPSWLTQLDTIENDVDILCQGESSIAVKDGTNELDPALADFLNNNQQGHKLRKLIRDDGDYLKDVYCSMGVLVLSRKVAKAGF